MRSNALLLSLALLAIHTPGCAAEDATVEVGVATQSSALTATSPAAAAGAPASTTPTTPAIAASTRVRVRVREIRVHVGGDDGASEGASQGNGAAQGAAAKDEDTSGSGWTTIFSGDRSIELDRTLSADAILGSAQLKAGKVTQIRLLLDGQAVLVDGKTETPITCSSCATSGLKILPQGSLSLESGRRHHLVLGFDLDGSVVNEGGALRFKPVIRLGQKG